MRKMLNKRAHSVFRDCTVFSGGEKPQYLQKHILLCKFFTIGSFVFQTLGVVVFPAEYLVPRC